MKETTIALEFLGRGSNFDSRYDNAVRMNVSRLRSRLVAYYAGDGSEDSLVIDIPKGSYVPTFHLRTVPKTKTANKAPQKRRKVNGWARYLWGLSILAVGILTGALLRMQDGSGEANVGTLTTALFSRFGNKETALICRNVAFLRVEPRFPVLLVYGGKTQASSEEVIAVPGDVPAALRQELGNRDVRFEDYWSDMGSVAAAFDMSRVFARLHQGLALYTTRSADPNQLRDHNLIVISTPWYNPVTPYLAAFRHFEVRNDGQGIMARATPGHPAGFFQAGKDSVSQALLTTLALIALQPGLSPGTQLLRITGIDPLGVQGGVSFISSEQGLKQLVRGLNLQSIPDHFEAVVRVRCLRGQVAGMEFVRGAADSQ